NWTAARLLPGLKRCSCLAWRAQPPRLHQSAPRRPDRVFGESAEHCTRGACAPHAKHRYPKGAPGGVVSGALRPVDPMDLSGYDEPVYPSSAEGDERVAGRCVSRFSRRGGVNLLLRPGVSIMVSCLAKESSKAWLKRPGISSAATSRKTG